MVLPDRKRGDAHAATHEQWAATLLRLGETAAERAEQPQLLTLAQLAQTPCAGSYILQQKVRLAIAEARIGEGSRKVGSLVLPGAPALGGGEHRELPGGRLGPVWIGGLQNAMGAERFVLGDCEQAPSERCEDTRLTAPRVTRMRLHARVLGTHAACASMRGSSTLTRPVPYWSCPGGGAALAARARRARLA